MPDQTRQQETPHVVVAFTPYKHKSYTYMEKCRRMTMCPDCKVNRCLGIRCRECHFRGVRSNIPYENITTAKNHEGQHVAIRTLSK